MGRNTAGYGAQKIGWEEEKRAKFTKEIEVSDDTKLRYEVQGLIEARVIEGKNKEEIMAELESVPQYSKYNVFFDSWVSNKLEKGAQQTAQNKEIVQDEERGNG